MRRRSTPATASWAWSAPTSCSAYLDGFLRSVDWPVGRVLIVNDARPGAGRSCERAPAAPAPATTVATRCPAALAELPLADLLGGPARVSRASPATRSWRSGWPSAPFSLLYVVSGAGPDRPDPAPVQALRPDPGRPDAGAPGRPFPAAATLRPPGAAPGAAHPGRERRPPGQSPARVPALWRPWFDAVSDAFAAGRDYQARLEASEARLKAAAESIPDGARDLRRRGSAGLLQQPLPGSPHRKRAGDDGAGQALAGLGPRGDRAGAGLSSRDGRRLSGAPHCRSRPEQRRPRASADRRPLGAGAREPHAGWRPRAPDHRHHRRAARSAGARAGRHGDGAGRRFDRDHRHRATACSTSTRPSRELTGYTAEEVLGRTPGELLRSDAHAPEFYAEIDRDDPCRAGVEGPHRQPAQVGQPDPPGSHDLADPRTSPAS